MERRSDPDLNQVSRRASGPRTGTVVDARMTLALWLRAGRSQRGMSLEDVARVTKIQVRILERLEAGKPDGLPADVFVRGFVRSVAKCVGLDEAEALRRYSACNSATQASPAARAMVEAMTELAPALGQAMARPATASDLAAGSAKDLPIVADAPVILDFIATSVAAVDPADLDDGYDSIDVVIDAAPADATVAVEAATVIEAVAQAVIDAGVPSADAASTAAAEAAPIEPAPTKKKRAKRATVAKPRASKRKTARMATGTPAEPTAIVDALADAMDRRAADANAVAKRGDAPATQAADPAIGDTAGASDDPFAPKLTVYAPDDLFGPRPYEPDAVATAPATEADDPAPAQLESQGATVDADMSRPSATR